ncbi:hypothetical protein BV898_16171 [Hypsibius exemplaris]|uniref:Uncharacterized protein n=1 Tax=Hypsibius exemplaris TaxID=2072580 RepID=A0A9X6NFC1_HYPEX|nr:hypothetical protein BV898_16171 [Hypsibius exemplaris]
MPNPHGLLYIPDTEQDFRAKQMAETDCLLKIRAVLYSRLSSVSIIARKFFTIARVPLEEARWYESKESQETASAPAPLDTAHLEKVD